MAILITFLHEVPGSNLGRDLNYSEAFQGPSLSVRANTGTLSPSFPVQYSPHQIIQRHCMESALPTESLNKLQITQKASTFLNLAKVNG